MIWYSLLILINIYKQKMVARVNTLYNNIKNEELTVKNNDLPIKRYYLIKNYSTGIDHRYKYNNETKLQNAYKLAEIKTNFHKKKWLDILVNKKDTMQYKLALIKENNIKT